MSKTSKINDFSQNGFFLRHQLLSSLGYLTIILKIRICDDLNLEKLSKKQFILKKNLLKGFSIT